VLALRFGNGLLFWRFDGEAQPWLLLGPCPLAAPLFQITYEQASGKHRRMFAISGVVAYQARSQFLWNFRGIPGFFSLAARLALTAKRADFVKESGGMGTVPHSLSRSAQGLGGLPV
jgi:hypothetical protein